MEREIYLNQRKLHEDSVTLCYNLYLVSSNVNLNINEFRALFQIWLLHVARLNLVEGCNYVKKFFDKKFAYVKN